MEHNPPTDSATDEEDAPRPVVVIQNSDQVIQRDDEAIVGMLTGQAIEEFVYSFRQGGRLVEGLTLAGINEAANRRGGIQVDEVKYEELEGSWIATVKATDTYTGNSRFGAFEQQKKSGGRDDPHAFTKAVHKAQRNAIKQLLPTAIIKEVITYYLSEQGRKPNVTRERTTPETSERIAPAREVATGDDTNHQKDAFAIALRMRDALDRHQIGQEDFWNFVRRRFNVQSRDEMREDQWAVLTAELNAATISKSQFKELVSKIERVLQSERDAGVPSGPEAVDTPEEPDDDDEGTVLDTDLDEGRSQEVGSDSSVRE
jgi:hypothetical protein